MAYKLVRYGKIRDVCYPSDIAAERPVGITRMHWEGGEESGEEKMNRGEESDNRCSVFNRHLREGLGTGRPDNIDTPDDGS